MKKEYVYNRMCLTNNDRKLHGLPMHRKSNKKKRHFTRREYDETISEFLNYCNNGV